MKQNQPELAKFTGNDQKALEKYQTPFVDEYNLAEIPEYDQVKPLENTVEL